MKCDRCGSHFSARDAETDTRNEVTGVRDRMPITEIVAMTLCPDCVAGRTETRRMIYWVAALVALAVGAAAIAQWLL